MKKISLFVLVGFLFKFSISNAAVATPTNVAAEVASSTSVKISWTPVTGATSYQIYTMGISGYKSATASPFTVTGLATGTSYTFYLIAKDSTGASSGQSAYVTATPKVLSVTAPTGVNAAIASATSVNLSWNSVSGAVGYVVYRQSSTATTSYSVTASPYLSTGLTTGTVYSYYVLAKSSAGTLSSQSATVSVVPRPTPGAPTYSNLTTTSLTLAWPAATSATGYELRKNGVLVAPASTALTKSLPGLIDGTKYQFTLKVIYSNGSSPESASLFVSTPRAIINKPLDMTAACIKTYGTMAKVVYRPNDSYGWFCQAGATHYPLLAMKPCLIDPATDYDLMPKPGASYPDITKWTCTNDVAAAKLAYETATNRRNGVPFFENFCAVKYGGSVINISPATAPANGWKCKSPTDATPQSIDTIQSCKDYLHDTNAQIGCENNDTSNPYCWKCSIPYTKAAFSSASACGVADESDQSTGFGIKGFVDYTWLPTAPQKEMEVCFSPSFVAADSTGNFRKWAQEGLESSWNAKTPVKFFGFKACNVKKEKGALYPVEVRLPSEDSDFCTALQGNDYCGMARGFASGLDVCGWKGIVWLNLDKESEFSCVRPTPLRKLLEGLDTSQKEKQLPYFFKQTLVHEFGHVLGLRHEHARFIESGTTSRNLNETGFILSGYKQTVTFEPFKNITEDEYVNKYRIFDGIIRMLYATTGPASDYAEELSEYLGNKEEVGEVTLPTGKKVLSNLFCTSEGCVVDKYTTLKTLDTVGSPDFWSIMNYWGMSGNVGATLISQGDIDAVTKYWGAAGTSGITKIGNLVFTEAGNINLAMPCDGGGYWNMSKPADGIHSIFSPVDARICTDKGNELSRVSQLVLSDTSCDRRSDNLKNGTSNLNAVWITEPNLNRSYKIASLKSTAGVEYPKYLCYANSLSGQYLADLTLLDSNCPSGWEPVGSDIHQDLAWAFGQIPPKKRQFCAKWATR